MHGFHKINTYKRLLYCLVKTSEDAKLTKKVNIKSKNRCKINRTSKSLRLKD